MSWKERWRNLTDSEMAFLAIPLVIMALIAAVSIFSIVNESGGYEPKPGDPFMGSHADSVSVVYDAENGVCYAVTADGGITPMYNPDGTIKVVD